MEIEGQHVTHGEKGCVDRVMGLGGFAAWRRQDPKPETKPKTKQKMQQRCSGDPAGDAGRAKSDGEKHLAGQHQWVKANVLRIERAERHDIPGCVESDGKARFTRGTPDRSTGA
jgi:hypothetical protein